MEMQKNTFSGGGGRVPARGSMVGVGADDRRVSRGRDVDTVRGERSEFNLEPERQGGQSRQTPGQLACPAHVSSLAYAL